MCCIYVLAGSEFHYFRPEEDLTLLKIKPFRYRFKEAPLSLNRVLLVLLSAGYMILYSTYLNLNNVADPDPGSVAFLTPRSGVRDR
jgi:hypothetical protein